MPPKTLSLKFHHVAAGLHCPGCGSDDALQKVDASIVCANCGERYPVVDGIPILINERKSVFRQEDFLAGRQLFFDTSRRGRIASTLGRCLSSIGGHTGKENFERLRSLLRERLPTPRILVIGGSIPGVGMEGFLSDPGLEILESDVSWGPRTQIILDAHNIPYGDESFDCVIAQAVLEHVLDPWRCVAEIHRVLRPRALVYAETPFMQQVHGGAYDFTRFTHSGHRRLFNRFEEVESGPIAGAGTVMAWSYEYLLLALLGSTKSLRQIVKGFARLTGFWLKYLDRLTNWNPYSIEAASGYYFIGRKSDRVVTDQEIVDYYRRVIGRQQGNPQ